MAKELQQQSLKIITLMHALHQISLCGQNSISSKRECGRIAREAIDDENNEYKDIIEYASRYNHLRENENGVSFCVEYDGNIGATPYINGEELDSAIDSSLCQ